MTAFEVLVDAGLDLDPSRHSFTYTYPPSRVAKRDGRRGGRLSESVPSWPDYSLYLHIPFCRMSCRFCSLHRELISGERRPRRYDEALLREVRLLREAAGSVQLHSIYVGGGTPTARQAETLALLLDEAAAATRDAPEITVECAPDQGRSYEEWVRYFEVLRDLRRPVTRVSIGVEAADEEVLNHMGRRGGRSAIASIVTAAEQVFDSYNVDLLLGYPTSAQYSGQGDAAQVINAVNWLRSLGARMPSISIYQMWDVGFVPATRPISAGRPPAEEVWAAKSAVQKYLYSEGYGPSPGSTYITDSTYVHQWTRHRCLEFRHVGLGSGSYSFLPSSFSQRERDVDGYVSALEGVEAFRDLEARVSETYDLDADERELRRVILGLRTTEWIDEPTDLPGTHELRSNIESLVAADVLDSRPGSIRLNPNAFAWSDEVSAALHPVHAPRNWRAPGARR